MSLRLGEQRLQRRNTSSRFSVSRKPLSFFLEPQEFHASLKLERPPSRSTPEGKFTDTPRVVGGSVHLYPEAAGRCFDSASMFDRQIGLVRRNEPSKVGSGLAVGARKRAAGRYAPGPATSCSFLRPVFRLLLLIAGSHARTNKRRLEGPRSRARNAARSCLARNARFPNGDPFPGEPRCSQGARDRLWGPRGLHENMIYVLVRGTRA